MKIIITTLFCSLCVISFSQQYDNIWMFGRSNTVSNSEHFYLDFQFNPPLYVEGSWVQQIRATNASFCSEEGDLEFFTNGLEIVNADYNQIENGDEINCCNFFYQDFLTTGYPGYKSAYFVPSTIDENILFLIHSKYGNELGVISFEELLYTKIDKTANNNSGKVIEKNVILLDNTISKLISATTKHANGKDWWIVTPHRNESKLSTILLANDEFSSPNVQDLGFPDTFLNSLAEVVLFSPDGTKLAYFSELNQITLAHFDRCSGVFSQAVKFENIPLSFDINIGSGSGLAFSADGRFLYSNASYLDSFSITTQDTLRYILNQFDTHANEIEASRIQIENTFKNQCCNMQLAPNGKIYIDGGASQFNEPSFHVINHPNRKGDSCNFVSEGLKLPTNNVSHIPNFPNYRLGPIDGSPCDTLGIDNLPVANFRCDPDSSQDLSFEFIDLSYYEPTEWSWSFGDGEMSADTSPVHTFAELGIYEVCLTVSNDNASDTYCKILDMNPVGLEEIELEEGAFLVYPNPTSGHFSVKTTERYLHQSLTFVLTNITGKVIQQQSSTLATTRLDLDISPYPEGVYFLKIFDEEVTLFTDKIILTK